MLCFGNNFLGQAAVPCVDDAPRVFHAAPLPVADGIIAFDAGGETTVAIRSDGAVLCWGACHVGEAMGCSAERIDISAASDVAVGWRHGCALIADGTVKCWGWNSEGQLGDGRVSPLQSGPRRGGAARARA